MEKALKRKCAFFSEMRNERKGRGREKKERTMMDERVGARVEESKTWTNA